MASSRAGGMHVQSQSSVTMLNCELEDNHGHNGGGAFVDSTSSLLASACHFEANQGDGGAIHTQQGSLFLADSTFLANSGYDGGAIYCWSAQIDVDNCLFQANVAEDDADDESETYELLVSFMVEQQEYGLYIPLDPFFVVARMVDGQAELVEGEDFDRIQPRIEAEIEEREWPE